MLFSMCFCVLRLSETKLRGPVTVELHRSSPGDVWDEHSSFYNTLKSPHMAGEMQTHASFLNERASAGLCMNVGSLTPE